MRPPMAKPLKMAYKFVEARIPAYHAWFWRFVLFRSCVRGVLSAEKHSRTVSAPFIAAAFGGCKAGRPGAPAIACLLSCTPTELVRSSDPKDVVEIRAYK